jgi:hypothetical protein
MWSFALTVPVTLTVALLGSSAVGCSADSGPGTVTGQLPLCYGPGPNMNLWKTATIDTLRDGKVIRTDTFPSDADSHRTYSIQLPTGHYQLHLHRQPDSQYTLRIVVRAGEQTHADFPHPNCL